MVSSIIQQLGLTQTPRRSFNQLAALIKGTDPNNSEDVLHAQALADLLRAVTVNDEPTNAETVTPRSGTA